MSIVRIQRHQMSRFLGHRGWSHGYRPSVHCMPHIDREPIHPVANPGENNRKLTIGGKSWPLNLNITFSKSSTIITDSSTVITKRGTSLLTAQRRRESLHWTSTSMHYNNATDRCLITPWAYKQLIFENEKTVLTVRCSPLSLIVEELLTIAKVIRPDDEVF